MRDVQLLLNFLKGILPPAGDFPVEECVHRNLREPALREGRNRYAVLVFNPLFNGLSFDSATPYVCTPDGDFPEDYQPDPSGLLYGWSAGPHRYIDHYKHDIHGDEERVIWFKLQDGQAGPFEDCDDIERIGALFGRE